MARFLFLPGIDFHWNNMPLGWLSGLTLLPLVLRPAKLRNWIFSKA
jgi:hypothetical protein